MSELRGYEKTVIEMLVGDVVGPEILSQILEAPRSVAYEYTGCGYFLRLTHPSLPRERIVCHQPLLMGESNGIDSGFVVFLEEHSLTLECHSWGEMDVPENYRDQDVRITAI